MVKKKIINIFRNILFNINIIYPLVRLYISLIEPQIRKAYGIYSLNRVKNRGVGCIIYGRAYIQNPDNLTLGDYVRIGSGAFFHSLGGIKIGNNTQISRNLLIYSENHNMKSSSLIPYDSNYIYKPVTIGNSVWIGMNVTIVPGVTIGDGAIIGMGTVVSEDIPAGAIVVGAKQRIVGYRDMNIFRNLVKKERYFGKYFPN